LDGPGIGIKVEKGGGLLNRNFGMSKYRV